MTSSATTTAGSGTEASQGTILRRMPPTPQQPAAAVLTLVTSMIFTRHFSAAAFGVYSLFLTMAGPVKLIFTTRSRGDRQVLPPERTEDGRRGRRTLSSSPASSSSGASVWGLSHCRCRCFWPRATAY
jgi:hypothetical protein